MLNSIGTICTAKQVESAGNAYTVILLISAFLIGSRFNESICYDIRCPTNMTTVCSSVAFRKLRLYTSSGKEKQRIENTCSDVPLNKASTCHLKSYQNCNRCYRSILLFKA